MMLLLYSLISVPYWHAPALVHFETSVESLRTSTHLDNTPGESIRVVDADTGAEILDGADAQLKGAPLGDPEESIFKNDPFDQVSGTTTLGNERVAYTPLPHEG